MSWLNLKSGCLWQINSEKFNESHLSIQGISHGKAFVAVSRVHTLDSPHLPKIKVSNGQSTGAGLADWRDQLGKGCKEEC